MEFRPTRPSSGLINSPSSSNHETILSSPLSPPFQPFSSPSAPFSPVPGTARRTSSTSSTPASGASPFRCSSAFRLFRRRPVLAPMVVLFFVFLILAAGSLRVFSGVLPVGEREGDIGGVDQVMVPPGPMSPSRVELPSSPAAGIYDGSGAGREGAQPLETSGHRTPGPVTVGHGPPGQTGPSSLPSPRPCRRTRGGAVYQADDHGRVCLLDHVDLSPLSLGCCLEGKEVPVTCGSGPTTCLPEQTFCVACCARAARDFSACRRECRTSSASVRDQRVFRSSDRFCFSRN